MAFGARRRDWYSMKSMVGVGGTPGGDAVDDGHRSLLHDGGAS